MDPSMKCLRTLNDLTALVAPGVYGVFDETNREVFISCSNNIIKGIASMTTLIFEKDHVCAQMANPEFRVLYIGGDQRFVGTKIIGALEAQGYRLLNKVTPVILRAKIRALQLGAVPIAVVTLRSSRGSEEIVAAFKSIQECEAWAEEIYPGGLVSEIVRLDSELTKQVQEHFEG